MEWRRDARHALVVVLAGAVLLFFGALGSGPVSPLIVRWEDLCAAIVVCAGVALQFLGLGLGLAALLRRRDTVVHRNAAIVACVVALLSVGGCTSGVFQAVMTLYYFTALAWKA